MKSDRLRRFLEEFREEILCSIIPNFPSNQNPLQEQLRRNQRWVAEDPRLKKRKSQPLDVRKARRLPKCLVKHHPMIIVVKATNESESKRTPNRNPIKEFNQKFLLIIFRILSFRNRIRNQNL